MQAITDIQEGERGIDSSDSAMEDIPKSKPGIAHYFQFCFQSGHFALVVPFRPVYDRKEEAYIVKRNWLQKLLTYALWGFSILYRITILRSTWQRSSKEHSPVIYFYLAHAHFHLIINLILYKTLLGAEGSISHLLNLISRSNLLHLNPKRNTVLRAFMGATQAVWLVITITAPILGYEMHLQFSKWSISNITRAYVAHARYTFFVHNNASLASYEYVGEGEMGKWNGFLGILQLIVNWAFVSELFFTIMLFGNCAVVLWSASSGFKDIVIGSDSKESVDVEGGLGQEQTDTTSYIKTIRTGFEELQEISKGVNDMSHLLIFCYILDITAWLSTELDTDLRIGLEEDWFVKLFCLYYLAYVGVVLVLSGESFRKVEYARHWLELNRRKLEGEAAKDSHCQVLASYEISRINKEIQCSSLGIGSVGFYRLNYSFIGQILALIITYFIISVQYGIGVQPVLK